MEVAKWLLDILAETRPWRVPNNKININANDDYAFRFSCENGHLKITKWLLNITDNKININADNDCAFVWSYKNFDVFIFYFIAQFVSFRFIQSNDEIA